MAAMAHQHVSEKHSYLPAMTENRDLDWLASCEAPISTALYDSITSPRVADSKERKAILDALEKHYLIAIENDLITVTPKGREYIEWRGKVNNPITGYSIKRPLSCCTLSKTEIDVPDLLSGTLTYPEHRFPISTTYEINTCFPLKMRAEGITIGGRQSPLTLRCCASLPLDMLTMLFICNHLHFRGG